MLKIHKMLIIKYKSNILYNDIINLNRTICDLSDSFVTCLPVVSRSCELRYASGGYVTHPSAMSCACGLCYTSVGCITCLPIAPRIWCLCHASICHRFVAARATTSRCLLQTRHLAVQIHLYEARKLWYGNDDIAIWIFRWKRHRFVVVS